MKKMNLCLILMIMLLAASPVFASDRAPLGDSNAAIKLDYIRFSEQELEDVNLDTGAYIGFEYFKEIKANLYLGGEIGYSGIDGDDANATFIPGELNIKYSIIAGILIVDLGAGLSCIYVDEEIASDSKESWLLGEQFFINLNMVSENIFWGLNTKYQLTSEPSNRDYDYSNWKIGAHVGMVF